jgi:hypothetical protein
VRAEAPARQKAAEDGKMHAELSTRQRRAIEALLTAGTRREAARQAGVAERTLRGWLAQEPFRTAYREAGRARLQEAVTLLRAVCGEAVEVLRCALSDESTGQRIRAAQILLDAGLKAEVDELDARVAALEARAGDDAQH